MAIIVQLVTFGDRRHVLYTSSRAVAWLAAWKMPASEGLTWPWLSLLPFLQPPFSKPFLSRSEVGNPDLAGDALLPFGQTGRPDVVGAAVTWASVPRRSQRWLY